MRTIPRRTRPLLRAQIDPAKLDEAGARRIASRSQIRHLLAQFLTRIGDISERVDVDENGIERARVEEAEFPGWAEPNQRAATDDGVYFRMIDEDDESND